MGKKLSAGKKQNPEEKLQVTDCGFIRSLKKSENWKCKPLSFFHAKAPRRKDALMVLEY
jgi:hypothetical protein